ncbi:hypothetical protein EDD86DRAFT_211428 [Gorgonomyces haynaldii]|nr:hypothetical protein EDD86DRAFT_211428 [Gorgonomyces haynaldii]
MFLTNLPTELLWHITAFLHVKDYLRFHSTCHSLHRIQKPYRFQLLDDLKFLETAPMEILQHYNRYELIDNHALSFDEKTDTKLHRICFIRGITKLAQLLIQRNRMIDSVLKQDFQRNWMEDKTIQRITQVLGQSSAKPLQLAAISGNQTVCEMLLDAGISPNDCYYSNAFGYYANYKDGFLPLQPLLVSVITGNLSLCKFFYDRGGRLVPYASPEGHLISGNPMEICIREGHDDIFQWLLEMDIHPHQRQLEHCIRSALENNNLQMLDYLIQQSQDCGLSWKSQDTFKSAVIGGNLEICRSILQSVAITQDTLNLSYEQALSNGHTRLCQYLQEHGAETHVLQNADVRQLFD